VVSVSVLAAEAAATRQRNIVWHSAESLWQDVTIKSPGNIRGLLTYGRLFLMRGDNAAAIPPLERAEALAPNSPEVQEHLATAFGGVRRDQEAAQHFARAVALAPGTADPYFYYGQWLKSTGRLAEAQELLEKALHIDPSSASARYVLLDVYSAQKNRQAFDALVQETLRLSQNNETVRRYVEDRALAERQAEATGQAPEAFLNRGSVEEATPEALLHLSSENGKAGKYEESIAAAQKALALKPDYAEAYNNIAAACLALHRWNEAVQAATQAVRLKPDFEPAKKVLQRAQALKQAER
jgi:tetratricopeptide (TPR) repeat protein